MKTKAPSTKAKKTAKARPLPQTQKLLEVVYRLRRECPWDRKQTHRSLTRYLLEEAYETAEAIDSAEDEKLKEELGDLLLQVVLHAEIAHQRGSFSFEDVAQGIAEKMIRRHPHIYQPDKFDSYRDLGANWTKLKSEEKPDRYLLEGTPRAMPALQLSQRYGEKAASVGFDWNDVEQVWQKVEEELAELHAEVRRRNRQKKAMMLELGDVFFTLANLARHLKIDAETSARLSAAKFATRFAAMERAVRKRGKKLTECGPQELEKTWEAVKAGKTR